jgi:hypothetical protein
MTTRELPSHWLGEREGASPAPSQPILPLFGFESAVDASRGCLSEPGFQ